MHDFSTVKIENEAYNFDESIIYSKSFLNLKIFKAPAKHVKKFSSKCVKYIFTFFTLN